MSTTEMGYRERARTLRALQEHGPATATEIADLLGVTSRTVRYRLGELRQLGHVTTSGGGRPRYTATPGATMPLPSPPQKPRLDHVDLDLLDSLAAECTPLELAEDTGRPYVTVTVRLRSLARAGMVRRLRRANRAASIPSLWARTPTGAAWLAHEIARGGVLEVARG